jgi:hypothetical protein
MKRLLLKRISKTESGTWGVLSECGKMPFAVTGEREDLCNMKNRSCIPEGKYTCEKISSPSHGSCFEVRDVPKRSHILFHKGNWPSKDSEGCILIAESFDILDGREAIGDSRHGFKEFMVTLQYEKEFHLTIKDCSGD